MQSLVASIYSWTKRSDKVRINPESDVFQISEPSLFFNIVHRESLGLG